MSLSMTVNLLPDGVAVLSVRGEIDHANADELTGGIRSLISGRHPHLIRVDLGLVTFIDSGVVGALVTAHRQARAAGTRLVVSNTSPFVGRQLEIAGVRELLGAPQITDPGSPRTGAVGR